jgi:hypothetical protein
VGGHSYAVESTWTAAKLRGLQVMNPWGSYVREYHFTGHNMSAIESNNTSGNGVFSLLLEDYVKRFNRLITADIDLS